MLIPPVLFQGIIRQCHVGSRPPTKQRKERVPLPYTIETLETVRKTSKQLANRHIRNRDNSVHIYIYIYTYIHTYTHTHTHIYIYIHYIHITILRQLFYQVKPDESPLERPVFPPFPRPRGWWPSSNARCSTWMLHPAASVGAQGDRYNPMTLILNTP